MLFEKKSEFLPFFTTNKNHFPNFRIFCELQKKHVSRNSDLFIFRRQYTTSNPMRVLEPDTSSNSSISEFSPNREEMSEDQKVWGEGGGFVCCFAAALIDSIISHKSLGTQSKSVSKMASRHSFAEIPLKCSTAA